jgi:hypothetical protein
MWESLVWLGLSKRVVTIDWGEYCWSPQVFRFDSGYRYAPFFLSCMRDHVKRKLGLDRVKPSRYVFMNRGGSRRIFNFQEIIVAALTTFRSFRWERIHPLASFEQSAILFNPLRLLFTPHGAGLANTLFMQPGSVICEVQGEREVSMFTDVSKVTRVNHVVARIMEMKHHGGVGANMSVEIAIRMLRISLSLL